MLKRLQCMQKTAPVTRWMKIVTNRTSKRNKLMTIESIHYLESILMGILPFKIPSFIPPMKYIYYILKGLIYYTSSLLFISSKLFWRIAQLIYTAIWRKYYLVPLPSVASWYQVLWFSGLLFALNRWVHLTTAAQVCLGVCLNSWSLLKSYENILYSL